MDISYSSPTTIADTSADVIEKTTENGNEVYYTGYFLNGDPTKCGIRKCTHIDNGSSEQWQNQYPNGLFAQIFDWDKRAEYTYLYAR